MTDSPDPTNDRKREHIEIIETDPGVDRRRNYFDAIRLGHRALPEVNLDDVDTGTEFLGKTLKLPLLISSMSGGADASLTRLNRTLAEAAEQAGVAMGVGSQRVMFTHPESRESFALRDVAPNALLFANFGAVQLNYGFGLDHAKQAVDVLEADALILHFNPLQEAIQPEGDTNFAGLVDRISTLVEALHVPVIAKEVGCGLSITDAELLLQAGVLILDVAGSGGTSWSRIENHRNPTDDLGLLFQDWGIPTPRALRDLSLLRMHGVQLIASGGIRSGLDMAKAIVLGASLCGMAKPFLEAGQTSVEAVLEVIGQSERALRTAMFLTGTPDIESLQGNLDLIQ